MKKIFIGLILILSNCSENKNQKIEEEFYQTFGKEKSEIIDEIVNYGSSLLMQAYNSDTKEQAYKAFVSDLQKTRPDSLELNFTKNQTDSFLNLFEKEKIKYDIFKFREENGIEKYIFDTDGKFMSVLNKVKETDKLAYDYYVSYNDTGQLPFSVTATKILNNNADIDDFLTERIIIIDFLYRYMTLKQIKFKIHSP